MKKWKIILAVILSITLNIAVFGGVFAILTQGFTKGVLTDKIYRPQNVFEEIWNLLLVEERTSKQTVLTTGTKDAYVDTDLGFDFVGVYIPENRASIHWYRPTGGGKELKLLYDSRQVGDIQYIYNYETKTLYSDGDFSYLLNYFLAHYFNWCAVDPNFSSNFSKDHLGYYSYQYVNPIWQRELTD